MLSAAREMAAREPLIGRLAEKLRQLTDHARFPSPGVLSVKQTRLA